MRWGRKHRWADNPNGCGPAFIRKFAWIPTRLHDGVWIWQEYYWTRWVDLGNLWDEYQWERRADNDLWVDEVGKR